MINYFQKFNEIIKKEKEEGKKKKLLLHACCAPCSTTAIERLSDVFSLTVLFYNPNITDEKEYNYRLDEIRSFLKKVYPEIPLFEGEFETDKFYQISKDLESEPERGKRCYNCYKLRLEKTANLADKKFDYFATTLTLSPHKNSDWLNEIGESLKTSAIYLPTDFKKQDGYKRSIELSNKYGLYRQNYCGCEFSKR